MTRTSDIDHTRWQAVVDRDRARDGTFVYAVRTTGVYCRPSCPARRAHRQNVTFFATPQEAELAKYRPCRRCRPHAVTGTPTERTVEAAREFLDAHVGERVSLARVARAVGASSWHLQRMFTRIVGVSPKAYHSARQSDRLKAALRTPGGTVNRATYEAGFGSSSRVYAWAGKELGMTPGTYRRGAIGETLRFGLAPCAVGRLLVAATDRGVAAVTMGDTDAMLTAALAREFPRATIERDDRAVAPWLSAIRASVDEGASASQVPLDMHGTDFQVRVWRALRSIPRGVTRTYTEIATQIGRPTAGRAVARACATNPASLVVPCHRVVRRDGTLGGYRWGLKRKQMLLDRERSS